MSARYSVGSILFVGALLVSCESPIASRQVPFGDPVAHTVELAPGNAYGVVAQRTVIDDSATWAAVWPSLSSGRYPVVEKPEIDFGTESVLLISMGSRGSGGHRIEVQDVRALEGVLRVFYETWSPGRTCATAAVMTNPTVYLRVPRWYGQIEFLPDARVHNCAD
jgi:hypothetical protein